MSQPALSFVGNTCNYAFWWAKLSRALGYTRVRAYVERNGIERDYPWWDDSEIAPDALPEWVRLVPRFRYGGVLGGAAAARVAREMAECDLVHAFGGMASLWAQRTGRPYVYQSYGDIASTPFGHPLSLHDRTRGFLVRRAMAGARRVVLSQLLDLEPARRLGLAERVVLLPIVYDCDASERRPAAELADLEERYAGYDVLFFLPARKEGFKRHDKVLRAFARFRREFAGRALLLSAQWGSAVDQFDALAAQLRLDEAIERVPCLPKSELIRYMSLSRLAVLDEFEDEPMLMSFGGVSRDALAAAAVLITRVSMDRITELHRCPPPLLWTDDSEASILARLHEFAGLSPGERAALGAAGRDWVRQEHHFEHVLPRYFQLYAEALN